MGTHDHGETPVGMNEIASAVRLWSKNVGAKDRSITRRNRTIPFRQDTIGWRCDREWWSRNAV
jgi:hypothetical protein